MGCENLNLQLKHYMLPHEGVIPGGGPHKKQTVSKGTKVYCIVHGTLIYWCAYLNEQQAMRCIERLKSNKIDPEALVAWNFKGNIPKRIARLPQGAA